MSEILIINIEEILITNIEGQRSEADGQVKGCDGHYENRYDQWVSCNGSLIR